MILIVVALAAIPALAQSGVVEGSVVDAVTKAPIAGAVVKLLQGRNPVHSGETDAQGVFLIDGVQQGEYRVVIDKPDYMRLAPDHPAAKTFAMSEASPKVSLRAELVPFGQVTGRALSPMGKPMKDVPVVMRRLWDAEWIQITVSGDGGVFRFSRLEPGTWILAVSPSHRVASSDPAVKQKPVEPPAEEEGLMVRWVATFFPDVTDMAGAGRIVVRPGTVLDGYDIKIRTMPARRLSGVVIDQEGKPVPKASVWLTDLAAMGSNGANMTTDGDGRFDTDSAMDGDWRIFATHGPHDQAIKGFVELYVSRRNVSGIEVRLTGPFEVKGSVDREEPRDRDGNRKVSGVYLIPQGVEPRDYQESAFHEQDGSFVLKRVYAGQYRILPVGYVPGYYIASILYGDQEVTTQTVSIRNPPLPIRINYRQGAASVTGTVEKGEGMWVALVPQDEALRDPHQFIRTAKCEEHGRFSIGSLRPGSYYAYAFDRVQREMLADVEFVRKLAPYARRVELRHGETANLELRPHTWPDF